MVSPFCTLSRLVVIRFDVRNVVGTLLPFTKIFVFLVKFAPYTCLLYTSVSVKGRDEFRGLAAAANDMIAHNKQLVQKVSQATDKLAASAGEVTNASGIIQEYSQDIANAIGEINEGMERQSTHCLLYTSNISNSQRIE